MKKFAALIGFSLVLAAAAALLISAPLSANAARNTGAIAEETAGENSSAQPRYQELLTQYYKTASESASSAPAERGRLEALISNLDSSNFNLPSQTASWANARVKKSLADGDTGFIDSAAFPPNLYAKGPPEKWIDFLSRELTPPSKVQCHINAEMTNCQAQRIRGKSLEPILKQIAFASEKDPNLSPSQRQKLKDLYNSFYSTLSLETRSFDWSVSPGLTLQLGARLGDDRAAIRAIQLVDDFLKKPTRTGIGTLQDSLFALQLYHQRDKANLDSRLSVEVGAKIEEALESKNVPDYMKSKLHALRKSILQSPVTPASAGAEAAH